MRASQYLRTGYVNARKARIVSLWSAPGFWAGKSLGAILIVNEKLELFSKLRSKDMCTKAVSALKEITRIALKIRNVDEDEDDLDYDE